MAKEQKLPNTVCNERERREVDEKVRAALREAQDAYKALRELPNIGDVPEAHNCTEEWVGQVWQTKKDAVLHADHLTEEQQTKQMGVWKYWLREVYKYTRILQNYLQSIPNEQYIWDASLHIFHLRNIDELVTERSTHDVPSDAHEHWELVLRVSEAIAALREWETDHDTKRMRLEDLITMSADTFAYVWAKNNMIVDHSYDHLPGVTVSRQMARDLIKL